MARKTLNLSNPGDSTHFGSDDLDMVNNLFTGMDQGSTDPIDMNTAWKYRSQKLIFRDPTNTYSSTVVNPTVTSNSTFQFNTPYDYYIFIDTDDANKIKARNGRTGAIDYSHATDVDSVLQGAIDILSTGSVQDATTKEWTGGRYGAILVGPGTFPLSTGIILKSQILIRGAGPFTTVFRWKDSNVLNNANQVMFRSSKWDSRSTAGGVVTNQQLNEMDRDISLYDFGVDGNWLHNLTIDQTQTMPTPGVASFGHGICLYSDAYHIENLIVHHNAGAGLIVQFAPTGSDGTELGNSPPAGMPQTPTVSSGNTTTVTKQGQGSQGGGSVCRIQSSLFFHNGRQGILNRSNNDIVDCWTYFNGEAGLDCQSTKNTTYFSAIPQIWGCWFFEDGLNYTSYDPWAFEVRLTGVGYLYNSVVEGSAAGDALVLGDPNDPQTDSRAGTGNYALTGNCIWDLQHIWIDNPRASGIKVYGKASQNNVQAYVRSGNTTAFPLEQTATAVDISGSAGNMFDLFIRDYNLSGQKALSIGTASTIAIGNIIKLRSSNNRAAISWNHANNKYNQIDADVYVSDNTQIAKEGSAINLTNLKNRIRMRVSGITNANSDDSGSPRAIFAENAGTNSFNGGSTSYQIPHYLFMTPSYFVAQPNTADAIGPFWVAADATNITVTFPAAPPTGTNNVTFTWRAAV